MWFLKTISYTSKRLLHLLQMSILLSIFEYFTRKGFVKKYSALLHNLKPQQLRPHCIFCNVRVNEWPLHFKISSLQTNIFSPNDNSTLTCRMWNANFFVNLITIIEMWMSSARRNYVETSTNASLTDWTIEKLDFLDGS